MKESKRLQWNKQDTIKFAQDALKVLAPYLIVIIPVLISQIPDEVAWGGMAIFVLQRARVAIELFWKGK